MNISDLWDALNDVDEAPYNTEIKVVIDTPLGFMDAELVSVDYEGGLITLTARA